VANNSKNYKDELFWSLLELKERLWLVWAVWNQQETLERATTLKLVDQALDLVQHRDFPNMGELRMLLDQLAAKAPHRRVDKEVEALKQLILSYENQEQGGGDLAT
jgi:hypothetical protein